MADLEVAIQINANPAKVWELVGDPTRMGEWSPETHRVAWSKGSTGPATGATFTGHNRIGWRRWSTAGTIVAYEPERQIAWDVAALGLPVAQWGYRIQSGAHGGCTLVEEFTDRRGSLVNFVGSYVRGVSDTLGHNQAGMEKTVAQVKAVAEAGS
ncbi:MAG: SRPBCC family protein [Actinomycetota bacterium]|nr:SRPBCC family protein [Actinomycetota bacterium]